MRMKKIFSQLIVLLMFFMLTIEIKSQSMSLIDLPVMGWSSWNTYRIHISEDLIKCQADAMVSTGLKEAGYRYVNIDDGFFRVSK